MLDPACPCAGVFLVMLSLACLVLLLGPSGPCLCCREAVVPARPLTFLPDRPAMEWRYGGGWRCGGGQNEHMYIQNI